jgi:hypothetical protein
MVSNDVDLVNECPECHANLVQDAVKGEFVCSICGYVVEENLVYQGPDAYVSDPGQKSNTLRASGVNSLRIMIMVFIPILIISAKTILVDISMMISESQLSI